MSKNKTSKTPKPKFPEQIYGCMEKNKTEFPEFPKQIYVTRFDKSYSPQQHLMVADYEEDLIVDGERVAIYVLDNVKTVKLGGKTLV
jgi:hypothetical protein